MNFYGIKTPLARRLKSTSGGVFQMLAEKILDDGGVVFGAGFNENLSVVYKKICSTDNLQDILGSKYVEADVDGVFDEAASCLSEGKKVLFIGLPCTISAFKLFIENKCKLSLDNLFLVDFVCSGVPEKGFWEAYLHFLENTIKNQLSAKSVKITNFTFRDKAKPDSAHTVSWEYDIRFAGEDSVDHKRGECPFTEDRYCRILIKTLSLQQRCFQCRWCSLLRPGDLTLGDYWGVEKYHPSFDDGYGISLCITNNEKGKSLLEGILPYVDYLELNEEEIMQPRLSFPNKQSILNTLFRKDLLLNGKAEDCDIEMILKKYGK